MSASATDSFDVGAMVFVVVLLVIGGFAVGQAVGHDSGEAEEKARHANPASYPAGSCEQQIAACESAGADPELRIDWGAPTVKRHFVCSKQVELTP